MAERALPYDFLVIQPWENRNQAGQCAWCGKLVSEEERNWNAQHTAFICGACYDEALRAALEDRDRLRAAAERLLGQTVAQRSEFDDLRVALEGRDD